MLEYFSVNFPLIPPLPILTNSSGGMPVLERSLVKLEMTNPAILYLLQTLMISSTSSVVKSGDSFRKIGLVAEIWLILFNN